MKKNLIFFTVRFPYGTSEAFIENEIFYLKENFQNIYIICSRLSSNCQKKRNLPSNFYVIDGYKLNVWDRTIKSEISAVTHLFDYGADWKLIREFEHTDLRKKAYYGYTLNRAKSQINDIIPKVRALNLDPKETVIYSYWFDSLAYVASIVNKEVFHGGCKVITRAHRNDLYDVNQYFSPLKALAARNVDKVYACSNNGAEFLKEKYGVYKEKFHVSYLGTKDYGIETGKKCNTFNICSCSYIKPVKRVDLILEALAKINDSSVKICWTHYGDGNHMNHNFPSLAKEILPDNIKAVFYGEIENKVLMEKYKNGYYDLFINVSESEGLPVSIMEAMSFGIPVIATNVGGTNEIVDDETGFIMEKDFRTDELTELILKFVHMDDQQIEMYRNKSRNKWNSRFNAIKNYNAFVDMLKNE